MELNENGLVEHILSDEKDWEIDSDPQKIEVCEGVDCKILAPGVLLFQAIDDFGKEVNGAHILVSGGIHPNENEGIMVLEEIVSGLVDGKINLSSGKVMCVLGNIDEFKVARIEQRDTTRSLSFNLNRLFGIADPPKGAEGSPEWYRAKLLERIVADFAPSFHFDLHCTRRDSLLGAFAVYPYQKNSSHSDFLGILKAMNIKHVLVNPYELDTTQTTFTAWTSQALGCNSATIELGEKNTDKSKAMVDKVTSVIQSLIEGGDLATSLKSDITLWEFVREVIRTRNEFTFISKHGRPFVTFDPLESGEVFAIDGGRKNGILHKALEGERIVFPANDVEKGQRAGVIVQKKV